MDNCIHEMKRLRKEYGLTQYDVSVLLGVSESRYSQSESGFYPPSEDTISRIDNLLNNKHLLAERSSVKRPYGFKNLCNAIYDESLLLSAFHWYIDGNYPPKRQRDKQSIFSGGYPGYPCVSVNREQVNIHILIMMYKLNVRELDGYIVHHKDENILNANIDNLVLLTRAEHNAIHHENKHVSSDTRRKLSIKTKSNNRRRDISGADVYRMRESGMIWRDIGKAYNAHKDTVRSRYKDYLSTEL